jgi:hypothetical protein
LRQVKVGVLQNCIQLWCDLLHALSLPPEVHCSNMENVAQNLLGCTAMFLSGCRLTFQRCMLPPSSSWWALMMEAAHTSEMSVSIQLKTWQYVPEDFELRTHCR